MKRSRKNNSKVDGKNDGTVVKVPRVRTKVFSQMETETLCALAVQNGLATNVTNALTPAGRESVWEIVLLAFNATPNVFVSQLVVRFQLNSIKFVCFHYFPAAHSATIASQIA